MKTQFSDETNAIDPGDLRYPEGLEQLSVSGGPPPPRLYVRGIFPVRPVVAIVGRRSPGEEAANWAFELAKALAIDGWTIGSGGAEGIDTAAHRGALAAGEPTLVVTAGGLDQPPKHAETRAMFAEVLKKGGAIASVDRPGTPADNPRFLRRNTILAGIAFAVVAVELRQDRMQFGGTGHMTRQALAIGRTVMTLPHAPWSPGGKGAVYALRQGAVPVETIDDVRAVLATCVRRGRPRSTAAGHGQLPMAFGEPGLELGEDEEAVLAALRRGPGHVDEVCARTGLDAGAAQRALLICCAAGVVVEGPLGTYRAALRATA